MFLRLVGVNLVTRPTRQALNLLVDMNEVQVSVAVTESCQLVCLCDQCQGRIVTGKAKFISVLLKGGIKRGRILFIQQARAGTSVNLMALGTVIHRNWSVQVVARGQYFGHVRYFPAWSFDLFVMALQAQRPCNVPEKV
jgi:hypothetical protein